jgi:hypothetical protein
MAPRLTQPLTEMSTRNLPGGKGRPAPKAEKLTSRLWADCLENVGTSTSKTLWTSTASYRDSFTLFCHLFLLRFLTLSLHHLHVSRYFFSTSCHFIFRVSFLFDIVRSFYLNTDLNYVTFTSILPVHPISWSYICMTRAFPLNAVVDFPSSSEQFRDSTLNHAISASIHIFYNSLFILTFDTMCSELPIELLNKP